MKLEFSRTSEHFDRDLEATILGQIDGHRMKHKNSSGTHALDLAKMHGYVGNDDRFLVTWRVIARQFTSPPWRVSRDGAALLVYMPSADRNDGLPRTRPLLSA